MRGPKTIDAKRSRKKTVVYNDDLAHIQNVEYTLPTTIKEESSKCLQNNCSSVHMIET